MRPSRRDIIITTRASNLAQTQSLWVGEKLHALSPTVELRLLPLTSEADRIADKPLAGFGGKGLFTRTIEEALIAKRADIAVHSMKDLPTAVTRGLIVAAVPKRAPAHDVLISGEADSIDALPDGATVATSSPRRGAQLLRLRPDLKIEPLRGNVETRISRILEEKRAHATILAAAGLHRLGLSDHLAKAIPVEQMLPAAAQGALAVQCRADDHTTMRRLMSLNDSVCSMLVDAERAVVAALHADCHSPLAVYGESDDGRTVRLRACVLSADGTQVIEADETGSLRDIDDVTEAVTSKLITDGAKQLLRAVSKR